MKPLGLGMSVNGDAIQLHAHVPSKVEDKIWEAVEEAIREGWTPKQFIGEARDAWEDERKRDMKDEMREFDGAMR